MQITRREVLSATAAAAAPSDRLALAGIGVGGVGASYLKGLESERIVALCDVDLNFAARVFQTYPDARRYQDFRVLLEREKGIDGVVIGTPDHTHAVIALAALQAGKHVYCAKPLTRTVAECRRLERAAREAGRATQMSTQSSMSAPACVTVDWVRAGVIGRVREVYVWSDRPIWPQAMLRPPEIRAVPAGLDWDLWLGPAPDRPFHEAYHPFRFRGWVDFGTGAVGDMACHAFHVVWRALELTDCEWVDASVSVEVEPHYETVGGRLELRTRRRNTGETFPGASHITWNFAKEGVRLHWLDGGLKPPRPADLPLEESFGGHGQLWVGEKGLMLSGFTGGPKFVSARQRAQIAPPPAKLVPVDDHYQEWIRACKGGPAASMEWRLATRITESALLGTVAQRCARLLRWEPGNMKFTADEKATAMLMTDAKKGWELS